VPSLNPTLGTFSFVADLRTASEVPPVIDSESACSGQGRLVIRARLDQSGRITSATAQFSFFVRACPNTTRLTLARIHEGAAGQSGAIKIDSGLRADDPTSVTGGELALNVEDITISDLALIPDLVARPASYYLNVSSTQHAAGLVRGQLTYEP
jgi:hypothetical protein